MHRKVQKWGNSLGLRIPKSVAEQVGVEAGSDVELAVRDGELVVRPQRARSYNLDELLQRATKDNVHREIATGDPTGREIW